MSQKAKTSLRQQTLRRFTSLDRDVFQQLVREFGYQDVACYKLRLKPDGEVEATLVIASDSAANASEKTTPSWPASWLLSSSHCFDYTTISSANPPCGWQKDLATDAALKDLPKSTQFYLPVQDLSREPICLGIIDLPIGGVRRRRPEGQMEAELEVICARISKWLEQAADIRFVSETTFDQHVHNLLSDVQRALDHELRTPLQSVAGYSQLLATLDLTEKDAKEAAVEYQQIIGKEVQAALHALERLGVAFTHPEDTKSDAQVKKIDLKAALESLHKRLTAEAPMIIGFEESSRLKTKLFLHTDRDCIVEGSETQLLWALWEVVKNAAEFSRGGQVSISLYVAGESAIVDVQDDGHGIPSGAEELIFLRFYQEPSQQAVRRGRRGMGLGLYLARYVIERHFGQLMVVRQGTPSQAMKQTKSMPARTSTKGALFRFSIPLAQSAESGGDGSIKTFKDTGKSPLKRGA